MAITGLTGAPVHAGSWSVFGIPLPDVGVTEFLQGTKSTSPIQQQDIVKQQSLPPTGPSSPSYNYNVAPRQTTSQPQQQQQSSGNYMDYYAGWNPEAARADFMAQYGGDINRLAAAKGGGAGGAGGGSIEDLISSAYAPALQALTGIESGLQGSKTSALENVTADYGQGQKTITGEQKELEDALASQGQQLEKSGQSAYSEAIRNLNSLFQTMASRFGAGSSTGGASSEIIGQEFLRNQGNMRQQLESGRQSIASEGTKVKNYIGDKMGQLDSWKRDAVQKINDNFQSQMSEIALRRGEIEANKTNARIAALQNAVDQARQVEQRDKEFKMGLAQFAIETMQGLSGRAFTPQEIAGVVNDMLGQNLASFSSRTAPAGAGISYALPKSYLGKSEDEMRRAGILA